MSHNVPPSIQKIIRKKALISVLLLATVSSYLMFLSAYNSRFSDDVDGIAYMSIAQHYAAGDFATAINGYWSPAVSILMAPFIANGLDSRYAFMAVNMTAAIAIVILGSLLVWYIGKKRLWLVALYIIMATLFFLNTIRFLNPDLLLTAWTILFIGSLIYADRQLNVSMKKDIIIGLAIGIIGGIGYSIKLFAIPFFIVYFFIFVL